MRKPKEERAMTLPAHYIVHHDASQWAAVPANNGGNGPTWQWGSEILVGYTRGTFADSTRSHQCDNDRPFVSWLALSKDGGESWTTWQPDPYAGQCSPICASAETPAFEGKGFVMRVEGNGYHGNSGARWFYSQDRGHSWHGPCGFGGLLADPRLGGYEFTGRTAYLVEGPQELLLFCSSRQRPRGGGIAFREKPFLARTVDGGATFGFVSWIVPWDDPHRAVMPAPVRLGTSRLVAALRRKSQHCNWIDCYASLDNGLTWSLLSRVGKTEDGNEFNGNPPALVRMADGRLCCAYGHRSRRQILAKYSVDEGQTWTSAQVIRKGFHSANGWPDLGYVRLFQRQDSRLVAVYFWCTEDRPQTHIAATVFGSE
jgi:hypothetical protein